jgi:hypothetical protein
LELRRRRWRVTKRRIQISMRLFGLVDLVDLDLIQIFCLGAMSFAVAQQIYE